MGPRVRRAGALSRGGFDHFVGALLRRVHRLEEQAPVPVVLGGGEGSGPGFLGDGVAEQRTVRGGGSDQEILSWAATGAAGVRAPPRRASAASHRSVTGEERASGPAEHHRPDRGRRRLGHSRKKYPRTTPTVHDGSAERGKPSNNGGIARQSTGFSRGAPTALLPTPIAVCPGPRPRGTWRARSARGVRDHVPSGRRWELSRHHPDRDRAERGKPGRHAAPGTTCREVGDGDFSRPRAVRR